jgi:hypothetical protein
MLFLFQFHGFRIERKTILEETKRRKLQTQQKMQNELNTIERKVRLMGGVVKSTSDIENLLKNSKSMKLKKEKH